MIYDLVIVGAGPAGITASIYASCFKLRHVVIGKVLGGQMVLAPDIINYPGYEEISGQMLTDTMINQVKKLGGEVVVDEVVRIEKITNERPFLFTLHTKSHDVYEAKTVILATGTERRKLNVPGETQYTGRGVYYCAICEKQDYEGKEVAVVGGGNSAAQAAVQLAQAASKVSIIYRGAELRGDPIWLSEIGKNPKITVFYNTRITEIAGNGIHVTHVNIELVKGSNPSNSEALANAIATEKVFIEIGGVPGTALVIPLGVQTDTGGYIHVDPLLATNIPGIFAAGDLVSYGLSIEQISTAIGLGARATASIFAYLKNQKAPSVWGQTQIKR